jgi:hypothetical protein
MNRRGFMRLGALFVPAAVVAPRRAYAFLWARPAYVWEPVLDDRRREACNDGDLLIDANGDVCRVNVDIGKLIARSIERSLRARTFDRLQHIVITGSIKV